MPNRTTLNKYEMLVTDVRRLAKKKELDRSDLRLKRMAQLIALLSSNHSWKVYRYLHGAGDFDKNCVLEEATHAIGEGWRNITETDIEEVVNSEINQHMFSMLLFHIVDKDQRQDLMQLHQRLRKEYADGLEPIERVLD
ncbi:MAG: hypothetical protein KGH59_04355 [Candidatus Micrarchaeota archaeon]|nr:hypothetical protein [Candidatus Micrarchaeota archaeon]MDE1804983.1 hypothetical protein [Candidatus Micrarchaeota archaeon]MDE1846896.1 hypothetical protein [Candidatus Micrarchaeota archaeon]